MRRADPFASFIHYRLGLGRSKTQAGSKHQLTGITQAKQRAILGQACVFDQQTISRGLEKRGSPIT